MRASTRPLGDSILSPSTQVPKISTATAVPGSPRPVYPAALAAQGTRALVSTMFIVETDGRPNMESFRALNAAM